MAKLSDKSRYRHAIEFNRDCEQMVKLLVSLFTKARKAAGMSQAQVAKRKNFRINMYDKPHSRRAWTALMVSHFEHNYGAFTGKDAVDLFEAVGLDFFKVLAGTERICIGDPKLKLKP